MIWRTLLIYYSINWSSINLNGESIFKQLSTK
jgi:hypothetical protein